MGGVTISEAASQVTAVLVQKPTATLLAFRLLELSHNLISQRKYPPPEAETPVLEDRSAAGHRADSVLKKIFTRSTTSRSACRSVGTRGKQKRCCL